MRKQEYCWEELLGEGVSFERRMRHHEEGKEQVTPMTVVLILWSILFAACFNRLEMESLLTDCPFFYKYLLSPLHILYFTALYMY